MDGPVSLHAAETRLLDFVPSLLPKSVCRLARAGADGSPRNRKRHQRPHPGLARETREMIAKHTLSRRGPTGACTDAGTVEI